MDDPFEPIRQPLAGATLEVYVSTFCFDCRRLKGFLDTHDVPSTTVNISHDGDAAQRLESETGKRGVPYVLVNGRRWVAGYHRGLPGKFDPALFVRELGEAMAGSN
jgi:glutaredoxin